jgi:co-chaperonin GroES (HSP10)/uncharacterized protein YjbJ (UPF0337 family)
MNVRPFRAYLLVHRLSAEEGTPDAVVAVPGVSADKTREGEVLAVAGGKGANADPRVMVEVGDRILFERRSGTEIRIDGQAVLVVRENGVLAIVPQRSPTNARGEWMDQDEFRSEWSRLRGRIGKRWGKLTSDDLDLIEGDREMLMSKLEERYGRTREQVERWFGQWSVDALDNAPARPPA